MVLWFYEGKVAGVCLGVATTRAGEDLPNVIILMVYLMVL